MKSKNPNQIINQFNFGRNEKCPCGSLKKLKNCCKNEYLFSAKRLLSWLKVNDITPPAGVDYNSITEKELEKREVIEVLLDRKKELEALKMADQKENTNGQ